MIPGDITMFNFIGCYMSNSLVCENRLSYYHLGIISLEPYTIIAIILNLGILSQAMSGCIDVTCIGGHHSTFCKSRFRDHWRCRIVDIKSPKTTN